jgi:hypothetical protein
VRPDAAACRRAVKAGRALRRKLRDATLGVGLAGAAQESEFWLQLLLRRFKLI